MILAPHNGALGAPRASATSGPYSAGQANMRPYGLPWITGPGHRRVGRPRGSGNKAAHGSGDAAAPRGDVAVNLAATSLVANHWLYDGDSRAASGSGTSTDGASAPARTAGCCPTTSAPTAVGGLQDGQWYGGHYGWTWPHGLPCVGMAALIGGINAAIVTGDHAYLELARVPLDTVIDHGITASVAETPMSLQAVR